METFIGVIEAAKMIGVGVNRCREMAEQGIIPGYRKGRGKWIFNPELVADALKTRMMLEAAERRQAALTTPSPQEGVTPRRPGRPRREPPKLPQ